MEAISEDREEGNTDEGSLFEGGIGGGGGGGGGRVEVKVLVVDDSPVERRMVEGLLKKSGGTMFQVISVDSGKRAMEVLGLTQDKAEDSTYDEQKVDIILTDYCMPEMTGYDLLKVVKEQSSENPIPVIIMSSENEPQRISRCRASGAEDFMLKPLQSNDVLRLRDYARPAAASPKAGAKRKVALQVVIDDAGNSDRRPRLAGLTVA